MLSGLLALASLAAGEAAAQVATKPKVVHNDLNTVEEFNVLTTDGSIRQGSYVKYRPASPFSVLAVLVAGNYELGLPEGEWRTFYESYPWNKLRSRGSYHAGLQEGQWLYYHHLKAPKSLIRVATPNGTNRKDGFSVNLDDSTAVLQAKGVYAAGRRVGLWTYYDHHGVTIQKVNHSANQLLYWRQDSSRQTSGEAAALNHPLLYVGGKSQLLKEILEALKLKMPTRILPIGSAEFALSIDPSGHQTQVSSVTPPPSTKDAKYQSLVVGALNLLPADWLPQTTNGQPVAADYHVKISYSSFSEGNRKGINLTVDLLGD
jgi:hypothetical protein